VRTLRHIFLAILLFFGCGSDDSSRDSTVSVDYSKLEKNFKQVPLDQDQFGFVDTGHCDSTLFSGMISSAGKQVDMIAAESEPGRWFRRPTEYPECWATGKSRSTISRDMLLGVYWHAWVYKDLPMLERLWEFGEANFWRMGEGRLAGADTVMNSSMISTLAQMILVLGGEDHFISRNLPVSWSVFEEPFKNRLTAIHLMLRQEAFGDLGSQAESVLRELAEKYHDNPLFLAAAGLTNSAVVILNKGWEVIPSGTHSPKEYPYEWTFVAGRLLANEGHR
jgi:hypothetical protein